VENDILVINTHAPAIFYSDWRTDIGIMHPTVTGCTKDDKVLWRKALRGRVFGQVEQMMNFAVPSPIPLHETKFPAELTRRSAHPLDVSGNATGALIRFQHSLNSLEDFRRLTLLRTLKFV
jgi:hypothetical protein